MATGVLPLLIGPATRLAKFYVQATKVYEARVRFGFATDTYDADGAPTTAEIPVCLERSQLEAALMPFRGRIEQIPPVFSAKKVGGVPSYKLAREKRAVSLTPVEVEIFAVDLVEVAENEATLRIHCGSGTYVRSIAHDLGAALGCGAHLTALRRTQSGDFEIGQAHSIANLQELKDENRLGQAVTPAALLLPDLPTSRVDDTTAAKVRNGRDFHTSPFTTRGDARYVKAVTEDGALLAIGEAVVPHLYHPIVVFH